MGGARRTLYDRVAEETASVVIRRYSTSFGLASRLLEAGVRQHVENIYALVRLADEIVDGEAAAAGLATVDAGGSSTSSSARPSTPWRTATAPT